MILRTIGMFAILACVTGVLALAAEAAAFAQDNTHRQIDAG